MNDKRVRSFVLVITLLCSLVVASHEANRKFARDSQEIEQDTVEQTWLNCREELLEITEDYEHSGFYIPPAASSSQSKAESDIGLLKKRGFRKAIIDLPPHLKLNLLKCLNKELSPSQVSGKKSVFINLYELFFDWLSVHRRYLLGENQTNKPKQKLGNPPAAPRRAGVPRPPEPSRRPTASTAPATPVFASTTLNVKPDTSPCPSPHRVVTSLDAPQGRADVLSPTSESPTSLYQFSATSRIQTRQPPAEAPEPTEESKSPAASLTKRSKSPALSPSPTEKRKSPAPSSRKKSESPALSPSEKSKSPAPSSRKKRKSHALAPSPTEESKSPAPSSTKKSKSPALAPSPTEESKSPAPSSTKKSKSPAVSPSPTEKSKSPAPSSTKNSEPPAVSPSPTEESKSVDASPPKPGESKSPEEASPDKPHPKHNVAPPSKPKDNSNNKTKTAVIVACSVAAAILVALFLLCCIMCRRKRHGPRDGQRDDKPPLNVCSGNLSAGPSHAPHGIASSSKTDFNSSNGSNLHIGFGTTVSEGQSSEAVKGASGDGHGNLPLQPRKAPPPPPPPPKPPAPKAPPHPKARAPPPPKPGNVPKPVPLGLNSRGRSSKYSAEDSDQKAKLKPFFWDKVLANPDHSMVWHDIKSGSFRFNEEMMESLFGYKPPENNKNERKKEPAAFEAPKFIQIIDPRKAQNLSILLRALNVTTEEVCDAIMEGNELPAELIQTLLKMAPTTDEELKLRLYTGDLSLLGPAERFLKTMVDIPFAFKRLESLLFMCTVQEEVSSVKESFASIEVACNEIKNSRVFLKLLEAVLKTGNRMNANTFRGDAQAFKLDTLLKLSDVKGTDGKTTLLHFVVLEIIRSEGIRAARKARRTQSLTSVRTEDILENSKKETAEYVRSLGLEVVSNLSKELENVKKAAVVDGDILTSSVLKLGHSLKKSKEFLNNEMSSLDEESEFRETLDSFVQQAEDDIIWLLEEEKKITSLVKSTADYFHGNSGKDEGLRLFVIVRDFLIMVDKVCNEVKRSTTSAPAKVTTKSTSNASSSSEESHQPPSPKLQQRLFPAIKEHRQEYTSSSSSSDDDS